MNSKIDGSDIPPVERTTKIIEPLRSSMIVDGHQVFKVGNDFLFSNNDLIGSLQRYPGERLPDLDGLSRFPIPDRVGEYCSRQEFEAAPKYMAQWVHWPERFDLIMQGRYNEIPPVHFEGIFTLVCNFMCPHCSRRITRTKWIDNNTWQNNSPVDQYNTIPPDGLKRAIDQIALMRTDSQMGIVWGGGDPTANPYTYSAMLYARSLGITASFLTNGVFLNVEKVLGTDPILIRISLNCGSNDTYSKFHGFPKEWDYFERVKINIRDLARRKLELNARTLVGISLIADDRSLDDLVAAAEVIRAVVNDAGPGIDYVIARPVFNYAHFDHNYGQLRPDTTQRVYEMVSEGGSVWKILHELGIPLILIKDSFEPPPPPSLYNDSRCLSYGMFGEIRHNGDVQLCSDSYGNPDYTIGNLFTNDIQDIWKSNKRAEVLSSINLKECYKSICPHNSRGHHYNRLFHQIEKKRLEGNMDIVRQWCEDLRMATLPMGHSFFI